MGVGQVLLNLLIAMLSSTYEENYKDARQGWKLHRASVLVSIDSSMAEEQRMAADKVFWQTSPVDTKRRCGRRTRARVRQPLQRMRAARAARAPCDA